MKKNKLPVFSLTLSFSLSILIGGCSMVRSTGVNVFADILSKAAPDVEKEKSWEFFKESISSQLKLIESMSSLDQDDERFLMTIIQGHSAYAFGVWETLYLVDYFELNDNLVNKERALYHYSKAIFYGETFLKEYDLDLKRLVKMKNPKERLDTELSNDETTLNIILFLAQSIAGIINLKKDQSRYLTALPIAKAMFDWVCEKDPLIYFGACPLFYAAYESSRPKMLGGNPIQGKELFQKSIKAYPDNYLIRVMFLQYSVLLLGDEEEFNKQSKVLDEFVIKETRAKYWEPLSLEKPKRESRLNLFNSIAIKRYEIMKKHREDLF